MPKYQYSQLTPEMMLNLYLYGQETTPSNLVDDSLIRPFGQTIQIDVDPVSFMSTGAGRFARLGQSTLVQDFFYSHNPQLNGTGQRQVFSVTAMLGILGGTASFDFQQRNYADGTNDLALRELIWGSSSFTISKDTEFVIDADGTRSIENWAVLPFDDNFDFNSANLGTTFYENELTSMMDPSGLERPGRYGLGRQVDLNFHNDNANIPRSQLSYTLADLVNDQQYLASVSHDPSSDDFHAMLDPVADALFNSGVTKFLDANSRPIIYGTQDSDNLDTFTAAASPYQAPYLSNGVVYVGGGGDDTFKDTVGSDVMLGGAGDDTADFSGGGALNVTIDSGTYNGTSSSTPVITVQINGRSDPDMLSSVETIRLSSAADTVKLSASPTLGAIKTIDAGAQEPRAQDVLDFSQSSDAVSMTDLKLNTTGTTFKNFEKYVLSDKADTLRISSLGNMGGLQEVDAGGNASGDPDIVDFSQSDSRVILSNGTVVDGDASLKLTNFEKLVGSSRADVINLDKSSITTVDAGGGNDMVIGGSVRSVLLGGDGNDQLFAGAGGATLDGGIGAHNDYVGGAGADTFVIGNGTHVLDGSSAGFRISKAGANDRLVLRLADARGLGSDPNLTKGIVLGGGVYVSTNSDDEMIHAEFASALVQVGSIDLGGIGSDGATVSSTYLDRIRPDLGDFQVSYDWDKAASTLDINISSAYGSFSVHVDGFENGQLGLNFVAVDQEPMLSDFIGPQQSAEAIRESWSKYNAVAGGLIQSTQIVDIASGGVPAAGSAAPGTLVGDQLSYLPSMSGGSGGSTPADNADPNDPNQPKKAPFRDPHPNPLTRFDPLVLDLSGNGLHLTDRDLSPTYVDFTGSGFANRTGWVDPTEGVLVKYDGSTAIGADTILGASSGDGFSDLAQYDTNADGRVDGSEAGSLRVWVDGNADGKIDANELLTLADAGVSSIDLGKTASGDVVNGNTVTQSGSFVRIDGTSGNMYEVNFAIDNVLTRVVVPDGFTYSAIALTLPELSGYGHVANLRYAMSLDTGLQSEALQLVLASGDMTGPEFDAAFEHLLLSWAGASNLDPTSRGPLIDARHMAVVEAFYGQTFAQVNGPDTELDQDTAAAIDAAYSSILDAMKIRFVAELPTAALANGVSSGDVATNPLAALAAAMQYNPVNDTISVDVNAFAAAAAAAAPTSGQQGYFDYISRVVESLRVDLYADDKFALLDNFSSALAATSLGAGWQNQVLAELGSDNIVDASGQGSAVAGTGGNDAILASGTDQTLSGGGGADVYVYSSADGNIVVDESSAQSRLLLTDIDPGGISLSRIGDDVVLTVIATGKTITMVNQPNGNALQSISFGDGTVWSQWQLAALVNLPNEYDGTIGADYLQQPGYNNETYVLGTGDDYVYDIDVNGNTFVYHSGDGYDFYDLTAPTATTDTLVLSDIASTDVSLTRDDYALIVTDLATNEGVMVNAQFLNSNSGIASIHFADGIVWDRDTIAQIVTLSPPYRVTLGPSDRTVYGDYKAHAYVYSSTSGNETIYDRTSKSQLIFSDIATTQISLSYEGGTSDLTITYAGTGKHVTVGGEFSTNGSGVMQTISFSDGVSWTQDQIEQMILDQQSAANGGSIYGFYNRNDTIVAGLGNKYLNGLSGSNTYVYSSAGGYDVVDDQGENSSVVFSDISSTGVTLTRYGSDNDLIITNAATGRTVRISGAFYPWNSIQTVSFADGVSWTMDQIMQTLLDRASAQNGGSVYGYGGRNDVIVAGPGDKYLNGEGGYDTYVYASADGNDTVDDGWGSVSTLVFSDIASTDIAVDRSGNDIVITSDLTGKTVRVVNELNPYKSGSMQSIDFADGVSWTPDQVKQILLDQASAQNGGSIYGFAERDDVIVAGAGDKYMSGDSGDDTYVYTSAGGNDIVEDDSGTLVMQDIASVGVLLTRPNGGNALVITVTATGKTVTISNEFNPYDDGLTIKFADGVSWDRSQLPNVGSSFSGAGWQVRIDASSHWIAQNTTSGQVVDLSGANHVTVNDQTYLLVSQFGNGAFASVQAAINAASGGETILIAPGTYSESTVPSPYSSTAGGFFVNKPNLTLQGVKEDGSPIVTAADAQSFGPTIVSGAETDFGSNLFIGPNAAGSVLQGLHLAAGASTTNKLVEFWANNVTIENNFIDTFVSGADTGAAAIYINVAGTPITQYLITGNILNEGIYVANGVGTAGQGISASQVISNNVFQGEFDNVSGNGRYDMVAVQGRIPGVGWQPDAAQVPTIAGNTRTDNAAPFIFRMTEADPSLFPTTGEVAAILSQNTDASTSYAYVLNADGSLHLVDRDGGAGPFKTLYVADGIETLNLGLTAPNALYGSYRNTIEAGDIIVVQSVGHTADAITVDNLTIQATASSTDLNLTLGIGVSSITLADYASGLGANVNVTGNNLGDTITGNSGNNILVGGSGGDTFVAGSGNSVLNGGGGYDIYRLGPVFGHVQIDNLANDGATSPQGEVDFGAGIDDQRLWFVQNGNDLQIDLLGTSEQITVSGWYSDGPRAQVTGFATANGTKLDGQISQLVAAMATYATDNPAFDPATATQMPTDSALQAAIGSAWHS